MSSTTAQVLMKKGKRGAAAYIHADCAAGSPQHLGPLLDVLLNPSKAIDEWETMDWCRWLLAGGRTPDEFAAVVRSYDKHDKCGLVWIPRVVAYRCRTCGISPCMSICRECFHRGDHSTHDFNMFLSQAGGACDCGDNSVMKEDGFCSNHGNKCPRPGSAPAELMCVAEAMMPRLILRLLQHFRENSWGTRTNSDSYRIAVQECEDYVQMLMEFNNMGDLMRGAMTKALINPQMYRNLVEPPFPETDYGLYMAESKKMYESAIESFPAPEPPDEYQHLPALSLTLHHNTLLDEFIFWTFKYEFPQNVVCFLLNMLPDQDYKEHLTRTFVLHYARIPLVLEQAADPDTLSNRVVHMSVQLFSNEALALRCVQQLHLLHVMVLSLRLMMGKILVQNTLHDPSKNLHSVIDCTKRVMKEHCYWPLVSDFNNVLSHKSVALLFLQDDDLVDMWFEFLSMLQGMNVNVREVGGHIEFEPSSYYAAFSCELEAAAYPMWSVLSHLTDESHAPLATRIVGAAFTYLQEWLGAVNFTSSQMHRSEVMHASFHFPLHRYLAAFLCAGVRHMKLRPASLLPAPDLLALLASHPLRVQSLFYEILAGIWVRNGLQIKGQAMTYIQANFCNSMVDMDIYLLQVCAAHMPADQFLEMCIDTFGVREWLSMASMTPSQAAEQDAMVEGLLTFLAILVSSRTNLGNDELTQSRLEVSTLLAAGDKTHSQLLELMPERSGNAHTRNFETVLKELSTYRPPPKGSENLEQGLFVPKPEVWERYYDPLHVLRRAVHRRDFHASMERFTAYVRDKQKNTSGGSSADSGGEGSKGSMSALWPPLKPAQAPPDPAPDPRAICSSGVLHGALLVVLHRGVHRRAPDVSPPHAPPDHVLALAVFLLRQAAAVHAERRAELCVPGAPAPRVVSGRPLLSALSGGSVCDHARTVVASVPAAPAPPVPPARHYPAHYHSDSDLEWEPSESETTPATPSVLPTTDTTNTTTTIAVPQPVEDSMELDMVVALPAPDTLTVALPEPAGSDALTRDSTPQIDYEGESESRDWQMLLSNTPMLAPPSNQIQAEVCDEKSIPVNESIISLLLKLHSQLSGRLDSFSLEEEDDVEPEACSSAQAVNDDRAPIGDGAHFIGDVLRQLARLDSRCAASIAHVRHSLWPHQRERQAEQKARERREKEERSRRARERQQQVMQEFARRQEQFLKNVKVDMMDWEQCPRERDYHCVICNTTTTNTPDNTDNPIGLCVLLQSTSVLGHRRRAGAGGARLALSEVERARLAAQHEATAAAHHYRLHDDLQQHFDQESWLLSVNVGWEGGVHAASCGHHLHPACLLAYLRSLAAPRPAGLLVERGEFLCPVCRQLANSVLPLVPDVADIADTADTVDPAAATGVDDDARLLHMLEDDAAPSPPPSSRLFEAMGKAMEDMTSTAGGKLKQFRTRYGSSPAAIFTFVASLARTSLECELVQRGGSLVAQTQRYKPRNDCIVPLLTVVGVHGRVLRSASPSSISGADTWRGLCPHLSSGASAEGSPSVPVPVTNPARPVPMLLRDPAALLMQLLLLASRDPPYIEMRYFTCIVRALYTLNYYQIVGQFCAATTAAGRAALAGPELPDEPCGIRAAARLLLSSLSGSEMFTEDGPPVADAQEPTPDIAALEMELQELLLPLLRVAALLQQHLYGRPLPDVPAAQHEFSRLAVYLHLAPSGPLQSAGLALPATAPAAARCWARTLATAAARGQLAVRRMVRALHVPWAPAALLQLPRDYDRLFTYYHERVCLQCGAVPKEASVCLLCGTLVCLKQQCCRRQDVCEAVQHAMECGGGTGIFLVVTSTYIIVIRGRRACLWGSLYLDDYDEEDRDLKRGKPLYLSQDRVELLQAQWLAHRFDHTKRTWVWHRDSL